MKYLASLAVVLGLIAPAHAQYLFPIQQTPPSVVTSPDGAHAAGFDTLAFSFDPSQTQPPNWLGCQPWDGQQHIWYQNSNDNGAIPCDIKIISDPDNPGTPVMDIPWLSSYPHSLYYVNVLSTMSPDGGGSAGATPCTMVSCPQFPNAYYEYTFRVASSSDGNGQSPHVLQGADIAAWMIFSGGGDNFNAYEGDLFEIFNMLPYSDNQAISTIHNWGRSDAWAEQYFRTSGYDARQYHTWAMRRTSDGNTTEFCTYLDGAFQSCTNNFQTGSASGEDTTKRWGLVANIGMNCDYNNNLDTSCFPSAPFNEHFYLKSAKVWSCSSWNTTMCNNQPLNSAP